MELFKLFWGTLTLRPYVFVFLIAFLAAGFLKMGKKRTLTFMFVTWIVAFICEFMSTRNGFPFGMYHYIGDTRDRELFVSNIPFYDSLSFSFLLFASYSMALVMLSPLKISKKNVDVLDHFKLRQSKSVLFLTTLFMMMIDVVIDPVALRGDKWFLGRIYYYENPGYHFGVPLSNAFGWAFVGFVSLLIYQQIEKRYFVHQEKPLKSNIPYHSLMGMGLYYGVLAFMLSICWWIDERALLITNGFIFLLPTILLIVRFRDPRARSTEQDWKKHCEDYRMT
ncbi:MAG: carotenoid biosynthesis protein [Proteobacteria bacterium]|jgi:uncharacterized membrane protein|nr:carotenoid biosynthesis protein [Pseudomonadota bacterium]